MRRLPLFVRLFIILVFTGFLTLGTIVLYAKWLGPPQLTVPQVNMIYSDDQQIIHEWSNGQTRYWIPLKKIAQPLIEATIAVEDRNFYHHYGFDMKRIGGAIFANIRAGGKAQGASTITQQYARNLFLTMDKTWQRKWNEALYTLRIEMSYSKDEILEGYLNTIYYGHGMYGIEAASLYYFGKHASELTIAESAMLAGIPKGPSDYSPLVAPQKAFARQQLILSLLAKQHAISNEQLAVAKTEKLLFRNKKGERQETIAPYFIAEVKKQLATLDIPRDVRAVGGLRVYTTLNSSLQRQAEKRSAEQLQRASAELQIGILSVEPNTGYVKALVGGRDYNKSPFNRVTQAKRQPGSTLKPLLYLAALQNGYTPSSTFDSQLTTFTLADKSQYIPHNYNDYYANGPITLLQALALSDNVVAVKTHLALGADQLIETAKKAGITTKLSPLPSLALGTVPLTMSELTTAYATMANGGVRAPLTYITKVTDFHGQVLYEAKPKRVRAFPIEETFVMTDMMRGMFDERLNGYSTVTGTTIAKQLTHTYSGKTGSTNSDSWMIGYSPSLLTSVWTGFDSGQQLTKWNDKQVAKQTWAHIMEAGLVGNRETFAPPNDVVGVSIDVASGLIATEHCPTKRFTYFVKGTEPTERCTAHEKKVEEQEKSWFDSLIDWFN